MIFLDLFFSISDGLSLCMGLSLYIHPHECIQNMYVVVYVCVSVYQYLSLYEPVSVDFFPMGS